jgi:hypothetical protein
MGSDNIGAALVEIQMIVQHLLAFEHLVAFGWKHYLGPFVSKGSHPFPFARGQN